MLATHIDDPAVIARVVTDPEDDHLIALARPDSVHALITGDKAVLAAPAPDLRFWTPRQFADRLSPTR